MSSARRGFTLIEMMVVIVIIGILATVLITSISGKSDEAKASATKMLVSQVSDGLDMFKLHHNRYPEGLTDLLRMPSYIDQGKWPTGGYVKRDPTLDAWKKEFVYNVPGSGGQPFDLVSWGADGQQGGEGVNEDIWNHDAWKQ